MFETPVLFIIFNRPDTSLAVFNAIKAIKPKKLYITADGPRQHNENDKIKCKETREIINEINWDCDIKTLFRNENLGCRMAVSDAIDWFFKNEEQGIILEDDCLPHLSFFHYCETLLNYYKNNDNIMLISGDNFQNGQKRGNSSYYFSRYNHIWGWASWRRAWEFYDVDMKSFPLSKEKHFLDSVFSKQDVKDYWIQRFEKAFLKEINTWDYQWTYAIFKQNGISILPNVNLISNIGFGNESTHTANVNNRMANLPTYPMAFPLKHPEKIEINEIADNYTFNNIFKPSMLKKILTYLNYKW
ncbi:MAG: nucleotide-diphospho-sugar transferase [Bacteroidales bacterium]|nr:nucleotide-diphospho-sugar transferase [Bacteroidales bacterium]